MLFLAPQRWWIRCNSLGLFAPYSHVDPEQLVSFLDFERSCWWYSVDYSFFIADFVPSTFLSAKRVWSQYMRVFIQCFTRIYTSFIVMGVIQLALIDWADTIGGIFSFFVLILFLDRFLNKWKFYDFWRRKKLNFSKKFDFSRQ